MRQTVAVGTKFMQEVNAAAILAQLRTVPQMSVSALSRKTGLSRQAVARSLAVLESDGYVEISAPDRQAARSGRPPQMVRFRSEVGYVLGVDVNPTAVRVVLADLSGETVGTGHVDLALGLVDAIGSAIDAALRDAEIPADLVWHASIAAPGIVEPQTGRVMLMPSLPAGTGLVLTEAVHRRLPCPVYVDNDVKLATQGERWRGEPRNEPTLVFVDWGERIGAGIVLNGELYRGASNDAGDIGYLDLLVDQTASTGIDSELGPFERWTGSGELLRVATAKRGSVTDWPDLLVHVKAGAPWALEAIATIAVRFAKGIAALRSLVDPETIVIGGEMAELGDPLLQALAGPLGGEALNQPRLELSRLGADAVVQGAIHNSLVSVQREHLDRPFRHSLSMAPAYSADSNS